MENGIHPNDFFILIGTGVLAMLLFAIGIIVIFYTSQRKLLNEKMQQQSLQLKHQQELLFSTLKAQEKERKRIAKDLHDEIGSKLSVSLMNLRFLSREKDPTKLKKNMQEVEQLISSTIDTTRSISHNLLPPTLDDFGLVAALHDLQDTYQNTSLTFDIEADKEQDRLEDKLIELNLFRVIQELLKNSALHGQATHAQLNIDLQTPNFSITYQDNGKGFDLARLKERKGLGTQNIESRLKMCGASIDYQSEIGKGVLVKITKNEMASA